ncbi:alpha/beta hydrolase [Ruegeria sp. Ofav3-42]|uniref:alpha/beta hydrolase n=1 Tax=Ruegeria sp. Ofav3-42 TaxID=2917759 RepID=UPI001EF5110E|nr:alpha/beta hydrolase [Ruegeria sp. Ofav3-42]MCG7521992.1 alpha/beta hydrolase [Ruegeria sp. Ofav3-42]
MTNEAGIDWTEAFANAEFIPNGMEYPARWKKRAAEFRNTADNAQLDIAYGDHPREKLDLFLPAGPVRGLVVIVHGGYWLRFDKSDWSHLAQGAMEHGWAVCLPSYILAPEAEIPEITRQIGSAITEAAQRIEGPIYLSGHSAGGQLVTRMMCEDSPLEERVSARIERVVSISGLHDLRPLKLSQMNSQLGLTDETAAAESAVLCTPGVGPELVCWVGNDERPEFLRQSALLAERWRTAGINTRLHVEAGRHHFDVIDDLTDPESMLVKTLVGERP